MQVTATNPRFISPLPYQRRDGYRHVTPSPPRIISRRMYIMEMIENACDNADVYVDKEAMFRYIRENRMNYPTDTEIAVLIWQNSLGNKIRCNICSIDIGIGTDEKHCNECNESGQP